MTRELLLGKAAAILLLAGLSVGVSRNVACADDGLTDDLRTFIVERVARNYHREDPRLAIPAAARLAQILDNQQVAAADSILKDRGVPPLKQILAQGRLMVFQFGSDFSILPPQGRELLLIQFLNQRTRRFAFPWVHAHVERPLVRE